MSQDSLQNETTDEVKKTLPPVYLSPQAKRNVRPAFHPHQTSYVPQIGQLRQTQNAFSRKDELASQKAEGSDIMKKFKNYKERINHFINESNEMVLVKAPKVREDDFDKKSLVKSTTKRRSPLFDRIELIFPSKPAEDDVNPFDKVVPRTVNRQGL